MLYYVRILCHFFFFMESALYFEDTSQCCFIYPLGIISSDVACILFKKNDNTNPFHDVES